MYYREVFLLTLKTLASSGTETVDIDVTNPITEILLNMMVTNDTSDVDDTPPEETFTKIELVDGGQTYLSMSGAQAMGVGAYALGHYPGAEYNESLSTEQHIHIPLRFGRFFGDTQFGLDPTKLVNPQLKITWSNASGMLSTGTKLEIMATVMEGVPAPPQCLFTKEIKSWTTAASGTEETDLPTDYPYRRLFARVAIDTAWMGNIWTGHKLDCDVGKLIVFDWEDEHFVRYVMSHFPLLHVTGFVSVSDADYKRCLLGELRHGSLVPAQSTDMLAGCIPTRPHYVRCYLQDYNGTSASDKRCRLNVAGWLPQLMYCYQFGDPGKPETWFNAPGFGGIKYKITEGTADAAASILLEQPRTLP